VSGGALNESVKATLNLLANRENGTPEMFRDA